MIVATHGNCLDGLASAALFTKLIHHVEPDVTEFRYRTCIYGPNPVAFGPQLLCGDANAILDYRFYPGTETTWYFDHHITAFSDQREEAVFQSRVGSGRYHFDPRSPSCAGLIARVAESKFKISLGNLQSLVEFANTVDSARYASAAAALDRSQPRSRFLAVVERFGNDEFMARTVTALQEMTVDDLAALPESEEAFAAIEHEQREFLDHVRACSEDRGAVAVTDISDREHPTFAKFASYLLFPNAIYSVLLGRIPGALKISLGFNPWGPGARRHDLGNICRRFGGGGHPVVGGVAFAPDDTSNAKLVLKEIVRLLERDE
jgi:hypothetical protein